MTTTQKNQHKEDYMAQNYAKEPSPQMLNAAREQQIINAKILSVDKALEIAKIQCAGADVDKVLADAKKIEEYFIGNVEALKPQSGIIKQVNMPPQGMFRPGEN